jgi:hypothetical protein
MELQDSTENERKYGEGDDLAMPVEQEDDEGVDASPEEQMDFDLLTVRARKMIFGKGRENLLKALGSSETPGKGIGRAGATILKSLIAAAKDAGRVISPDAAVNAGTEIAQDLIDLAKANKVFEFDSPEDEQKELEAAMLWGVKYFGDGSIASGEITPDMQAQAKKTVQAGLAAEQAQGPQKKPVAAGVEQALAQQPPQGLVGSAMQGGM